MSSSACPVPGAGRRMHVVVIGGGFAGITVAHGLEKSRAVDITLVDTKDYFEVCTPPSLPQSTTHTHMR